MAQRDQMMLMKAKDAETEKSTFEKIEQEFKSVVYGTIFLMLKNEDEWLALHIIILVVGGFQQFSLVFNPDLDFPWKGYSVTSIFEIVIQVFQFSYWFKYLDWTPFLFLILFSFPFLYQRRKAQSDGPLLYYELLFLPLSQCFIYHFYVNLPLIDLDLLMTMLRCNYNNGVSTLYDYPEVVCWQNFHILHACCAIIACIVFVGITLVVVLIFTEVNPVCNDPSARVNSRNEFWQNMFKLLSILISTFFFKDQYKWFLTLYLTGGSILLYMKRRNEKPYYYEPINTLMDVINALFMWSCFCLVVVMVGESTQFNGGMQVFFMSIPLISIMIITKRDKRNTLLLKQLSSFDNPEDWLLKIRFYITLVQHKDLNRESAVQLNGFLFHHEETCTLSVCPLKAYTTNALASLKDKKKKSLPKAGAENFALLMGYANQLFSQGISKFTASSSMHISFAIFLKYRMNNKTTAINELGIAEKCAPQFDDQFVIFRFRKILEDEMTELQEGGNGVDVVSMLAYENYFQQFRAIIEKISYLHMEFWVELLDPEPDLGKLDTIGMKINEGIEMVKDKWSKLQKLNPNSQKALKYYAEFLTEILNDTEGGGELLQKAKNNDGEKIKFATNAGNAESIGMGDICATMGGSDGTPCIVVSGEQNNFGDIIQFNMSICKLFGYTKPELVGRKIGLLMPDLFAKEHDTFLHNGIASAEEQGASSTKAEKFVLAKHKSGYLLPLPIQARVVISVSQGAFFVGTFKIDKKGLYATYLLLDEHQDIIGVSSKAVSSINLNNQLLRNYRVSAQILAPGLLDKNNLTQYMSKNGGTLDFFFPDMANESDIGVSMAFSKTIIMGAEGNSSSSDHAEKLRLRASKRFVKMNCILSELTFSGQPRGHIVRLEPIESNKLGYGSIKLEREAKYPNCQFVFDPVEMRYLQQTCDEDAQRLIAEETGEYVNILRDRSGSSFSPNNKSDDSREKLNTSLASASRSHHRLDDTTRIQFILESKRREYSEGIDTYRLVNGVREKIQASKSRLLEIQEEEEKKLDLSLKKVENSKDDLLTLLKSKRAFNEALTEKSIPSSVKNLTYAGYFLTLCLVTLSSVEFGLTTTLFNDIENNIFLARDNYLQMVAQMRMVFYINKIALLMKTEEIKLKTNSLNEDIITSKKKIDESLKQFFEETSIISLSKIHRDDAHDKLYTTKSVSLYYSNVSSSFTSQTLYTLSEAAQQMASEIFSVSSFTDYTKYSLKNDDVFFCLYNGFSDLYKKMGESANYYIVELSDRGTEKVQDILIIFAVSLSILIISICALFPIVSGVSKQRLEILTLFMDIPHATLRSLQKKCERFVAESKDENVELNSGSESNSQSNDREEKEEERIATNQKGGNRKHRYKNNTTTNGAFYLYYIAATILIAGYFATNFSFGYIFLKHIHSYSRELRAISVLHSETTYALSVFQGLLGNGRIMTLTGNQTFELMASHEITELYSDAQEIQISHNENSGNFGGDYQDDFISIMRNSICSYSDEFGFTFDCPTFLEGTTQEGLHPVIVNFIETIRQMLTTYWGILGSSASATEKNSTISATLLNSNDFSNMETSIVSIVDPALRYLESGLTKSYDNQLNAEITQRIILFIFFLLAFFISYLSFWSPFISKLNAEIWRTKAMLTLIPYDVCKNISSIKQYLNEQNSSYAKEK